MKKIAVYAGTFDPITNGHTDIIERGLSVFDRLIVAVGDNSSKKTLFDTTTRTDLIKATMKELEIENRVQVESFSGLLVNYAREIGASIIIRGLRAVSDYEYESQMAIINRSLAPEIDTVFLMTSVHCGFISSSVVREIARNLGDLTGIVPKCVAQKMDQMFAL